MPGLHALGKKIAENPATDMWLVGLEGEMQETAVAWYHGDNENQVKEGDSKVRKSRERPEGKG